MKLRMNLRLRAARQEILVEPDLMGELLFDGDVDAGLQFYEELLARRPRV